MLSTALTGYQFSIASRLLVDIPTQRFPFRIPYTVPTRGRDRLNNHSRKFLASTHNRSKLLFSRSFLHLLYRFLPPRIMAPAATRPSSVLDLFDTILININLMPQYPTLIWIFRWTKAVFTSHFLSFGPPPFFHVNPPGARHFHFYVPRTISHPGSRCQCQGSPDSPGNPAVRISQVSGTYQETDGNRIVVP